MVLSILAAALKVFCIVWEKSPGQSSPGRKPFDTTNKCGGSHVNDKLQVDCTRHATGEQANPYLLYLWGKADPRSQQLCTWMAELHWLEKLGVVVVEEHWLTSLQSVYTPHILWRTDLTRLLPPIIQYLERTSVRVSLTPSCWTRWCASCITRIARWCFLFRSTGCFEEYGRSVFCNLPPHLQRFLPSLNWDFHTGNFWSCIRLVCESCTHSSPAAISSCGVSSGDETLFFNMATNLRT